MNHDSKMVRLVLASLGNNGDGDDSSLQDRLTDALQAEIAARFAEELKLDPADVDIQRPFTSYGLDSLKAFLLTGDLAEWVGHDLPATLFWKYPTVEALSDYLADNLVAWGSVSRAVEQINSALEEIEKIPDDKASQLTAANKK